MASPSATLSGSCSEENHTTIDSRKRKRMLSNRESARRSRMRKQKHLDDLKAQTANLRAENNLILNNVNLATHNYLKMESENSVLRAQIAELSQRLQALNDIISCMSSNDGFGPGFGYDDQMVLGGFDDVLSSNWSMVHMNQPIMDLFMC
ncbi:basic-leucine zipper transcription factor family protein [Striga asiatica]|uniref:Basic-leucine zipper transcription factor family protein n=1 Tax=Striga asiatica TaxID=4170 RepID=A0A5A7P5U2_STRAF|nr:basic-leucine zipper transcription factor family protein [Striga asiatica]